MVYTPPRNQDASNRGFLSEEELDEMKEALDRAVRIPSPKNRESPKVAVSLSDRCAHYLFEGAAVQLVSSC
jgi:hypothetical protein